MSNVTRSPDLALDARADASLARLMARYCSVIDNNQFEEWPDLFTEACLYRIVTRPDFDAGREFGIWFCNSRDMLIDRVNSLRSVNVYEPHVYRHVIGPTEVVSSDGMRLDCETNYLVIRTDLNGDMQIFSAGRYIDQVELDERVARLVARTVVTDSHRYDTLVALPL